MYKIPAKILTDRLGNILPDISYEDQHGFVPGRGAQYNTFSTVHAIQDAEGTGKSLQLLGIDINGAFDSISRKCIKQFMILNGFPTHLVTAIDNLTKVGRAQIEVNGRLGDEFIQQSGVGQGDPLSACRFNIGTEPLLRALHKHTGHCIYQDESGTFFHSSAYADDHLHTLSARAADDVKGILDIYNKYTGVSGLHINLSKTELLTVNTEQELTQEIRGRAGISIVGLTEDTAHILVNCNNYSYRAWERVSTIVTMACRAIEPEKGIINLTFSNILYHTDILSLPQTYMKQMASFLLEFKKDIYVRRTERCISEGGGRWAGRIYTDQRIDIHISIACDRILQMATYKGKTATLLEQIKRVCLPTE